jgi:DNA-binding Lrp family transcriptional regulator
MLRVRQLERQGIFRRYTIEMDSGRRGYHIAAQVAVQQQPGFQWEHLENGFRGMAEIALCYRLTGDDTYLRSLRVRDLGAFEDLLRNTPLWRA